MTIRCPICGSATSPAAEVAGSEADEVDEVEVEVAEYCGINSNRVVDLSARFWTLLSSIIRLFCSISSMYCAQNPLPLMFGMRP